MNEAVPGPKVAVFQHNKYVLVSILEDTEEGRTRIDRRISFDKIEESQLPVVYISRQLEAMFDIWEAEVGPLSEAWKGQVLEDLLPAEGFDGRDEEPA